MYYYYKRDDGLIASQTPLNYTPATEEEWSAAMQALETEARNLSEGNTYSAEKEE